MKTGFLYWHPLLYQSFMRILYGGDFHSRYEIISDLLPDHVSVVDICCGDCYISNFLKKKNIDYLGLDLNPKFVQHALKRGIKTRLFDVKNSTIPRADYIVMQGSLYQFAPNHRLILDRLFSAANKAVIISETVENIASYQNSILSFLGHLATKVNGEDFSHRFSKQEALDLFHEYNASLIKEVRYGKDLIGLFVKDN